MLNVMK